MIHLTGFNLVHYLLGAGHLTPGDVFAGNFQVRPIHLRNRCFVVDGGKRSLFVKQPITDSIERRASVKTEATCYWLAANDPDFATLAASIPKLLEYDQWNSILLTEYVASGQDLASHFARCGTLPADLGREQGRLLASCHISMPPVTADLFPRALPAAFPLFGERIRVAIRTSDNDRQRRVLETVAEESTLPRIIRALQDIWRHETLIHGDVKFGNLLIDSALANARSSRLMLVDWELAAVGDPLWDVAAAMSGYLQFWVLAESQALPVERDATDRFDLPQAQAQIQALWTDYARTTAESPTPAHVEFRRIAQFTGLNLLNSCYTLAQRDLSEAALSSMVRAASLLLSDPDRATETILGVAV